MTMPAHAQNATHPHAVSAEAERSDAAATSLVISSETVSEVLVRCPRRGGIYLYDANDPTRFIEQGCDAYLCAWCGPRKARQYAAGVTWVTQQVDRSRFITITQAPEDPQKRRAQMKDLARRLRANDYRTEWMWTTERGSNTGMVHVHAVQWGDFIPQAELQEMCGGRRVDIRDASPKKGAVADYLTKGAGPVVRYLTKSAVKEFEQWRDLNGGRPFHASSGFFLGQGVRGAQRLAQLSRKDYEPVQWTLANPAQARGFMMMQQARTPDEKERALAVVLVSHQLS